MNTKIWISLLAAIASAGLSSTTPVEAQQAVTFFVSSAGKGNGADLGGLAGADAHCQALARAAGSTLTNWHAYLSTTEPGGTEGVNARDRIGKGPWQNAKGPGCGEKRGRSPLRVGNITKQTALTEKGETVPGRGDQVNTHDILTGSDPQGMFSTAGGDTTCGNWTKSGEGSAIVGHHDRQGLKDTRAHEVLQFLPWLARMQPGCPEGSGGAGLLYCFAVELIAASRHRAFA